MSILGWHVTVLNSWLAVSYHGVKQVLVGHGWPQHARHVGVSDVMFGETFS